MRHVIINLDELIPASSGTHTHTHSTYNPHFAPPPAPVGTHTHTTHARAHFFYTAA